MGGDVLTVRIGRMNIAMTKSIVSGADRPATAEAARTDPIGRIVTARAQTSASGADPPPTVPAAVTVHPAVTKSNRTTVKQGEGDLLQ